MRQQMLSLTFEPIGTPPSGEPPSFDVKSGPGQVTLLAGDGDGVPTEASYETHVRMTGESSFDEDGFLTVDGGGLRITTVGSGLLEPSAEEGTFQGAVLWRVEGTGRLEGATGLLSSNFAFTPESGTGVEGQVLRLFLP